MTAVAGAWEGEFVHRIERALAWQDDVTGTRMWAEFQTWLVANRRRDKQLERVIAHASNGAVHGVLLDPVIVRSLATGDGVTTAHKPPPARVHVLNGVDHTKGSW